MPGGRKPLTIRERDGKVIVTLDGTGWDPVTGELLQMIYDCYRERGTIAEFLNEAVRLLAERHSPDAAYALIEGAKRRVAENLAIGRDAYGRPPRPDDNM